MASSRMHRSVTFSRVWHFTVVQYIYMERLVTIDPDGGWSGPRVRRRPGSLTACALRVSHASCMQFCSLCCVVSLNENAVHDACTPGVTALAACCTRARTRASTSKTAMKLSLLLAAALVSAVSARRGGDGPPGPYVYLPAS